MDVDYSKHLNTKLKIIDIMKKQLFLIGLILAFFTTGYCQEIEDNMVTEQDSMVVDSVCHHRVNIHFGGAFTNDIYHRIPGIKNGTWKGIYIHPNAHLLELGYTYFFNQNWGLGLGVGVNKFSACANLNIRGVVQDSQDPEDYNQGSLHNTNADLIYVTHNLMEREVVWAIEVPLTAQFEKKFDGRNGIYAQLGVKGYFPIMNRSRLSDGTITYMGWDEYYNILYQDMENHGFYTAEVDGGSHSTKLRCSIDLQADFGGIFTINNKVDAYVGLFASYGFLNILPKGENKHDLVEYDANGKTQYNGLMGSNVYETLDRGYIAEAGKSQIDRNDVIGNFKWNYLQVGVKVGIHIKPCGQVEESARKKFYRKMTEAAQKYLDDTCNACDKHTEYIYIVPVCPETTESGDKLTPKEKKELSDLADDLEKIKILFDLDKDVPKINESGDYIDKAAKKLKSNKKYILVIEGYTCKLGPEEHNRDLAQRRAESIKRLFVEEKGVDPAQLELHTYTSSDPENNNNITDPALEEHRAAIISIKVAR